MSMHRCWVQENSVIDRGCNGGAEERANPIHPVVGEVPLHNRGSEAARWIHRSAGIRSAYQNIHQHREPDSEGSDHSDVPPLGIYACRKDHEDQRESEDGLH